MDELTIEDRKYVSSKRAAEITGYAKDYIGQLCRGGYVPARRIGRNWYVLESAIKDHRFGTQASEGRKLTVAVPGAQETPRYTAFDAEFPEPVHLLQHTPLAIPGTTSTDANEPLRGDFQEAWQAWFEMFRGRENSVIETGRPEIHSEPITEEVPIVSSGDGEKTEAQSIPLQILTHDASPRFSSIPAVAPHTRHTPIQAMDYYRSSRPVGRGRLAMQIALVLIATMLAWTAVLSTGFFDKTIISDKRVQLFSGAMQYNKPNI